MIERLEFGEETSYNVTEAAIHLNRYLATKPFIEGKKVLDVACGEGYGTYLMEQWGAASVIGVDIDKTAISKANKLFRSKNISYCCHDAELLPFEDSSFDVVVSFETIEHLDSPESFLKEIKRVLTPRGTILISCPNDPYYYPKDNLNNPYHKNKYTFFDFKALGESILGGHVRYYLGFAAKGFITIPYENSSYPEDSKPDPTMLEMLNYNILYNTASLMQEKFLNHWNCNFYLGIWNYSGYYGDLSAAIYPCELFANEDNYDIDFYSDVRRFIKYQQTSLKECQELQVQLQQKIDDEKQKLLEEEKQHNLKSNAEVEELVNLQGIEIERLKMLLELANKENAILHATTSAANMNNETTNTGESQADLLFRLNYYQNEVARLENSTCWKITKPLRIAMDFLKRLFRKS